MAQNELRVTCPACESSFPMTQALASRPVEGAGADSGLRWVGVECPGCGVFAPSYVDGPALDGLRAQLRRTQDLFRRLRSEKARRRMEAAKVRFQKAFDQLQAEWKTPSPAE